MPKLLNDIRGLMKPPGVSPVRSGEVVEVKIGKVVVKTLQGLREYSTINNATFEIGDQVRISGELVIAKLTNVSTLPVYRV